nr:cytospin-A-like [Aegilops tauschii subsp. strangulata]
MSANFQRLQALHRARRDKVNSRSSVVDKAEADFQERVAQTQFWFGEARQELKNAQDQLDEHKRELLLKQADIEKTQEAAKKQADQDEADRRQVLLDTQEEDLVARQQALAATLRGKDEEVERVEKLELEREQLKKEILTLTEFGDMANRTLADLQVAVFDKTKLLPKADKTIGDLKLKLDTLEGTLSEGKAREDTLTKALEDERQLKKDDATAHKDYVASVNLWISRLIDIAERLTTQLSIMGMPNFRYSQEADMNPNARLTLFFEGIFEALEQLR